MKDTKEKKISGFQFIAPDTTAITPKTIRKGALILSPFLGALVGSFMGIESVGVVTASSTFFGVSAGMFGVLFAVGIGSAFGLGLTMMGFGLIGATSKSPVKRVAGTFATILGAGGIGALIGSLLFPGIGTLIGGAIGAAVGAITSVTAGCVAAQLRKAKPSMPAPIVSGASSSQDILSQLQVEGTSSPGHQPGETTLVQNTSGSDSNSGLPQATSEQSAGTDENDASNRSSSGLSS
jgi:hypothetical protein